MALYSLFHFFARSLSATQAIGTGLYLSWFRFLIEIQRVKC